MIICIVTPSGPVEMVKEELKKQLPPRLLIPNNCIHLLGTVGQGKCGAHNVWRMRRPHALCFLGEFREVYKAHLIKWHGMGMPRVVAVKTLKGNCNAVSCVWYV